MPDISNRKKKYTIISVFVVLAAYMVVSTHYGTKVLSAVRAYIAAEGQWTKAQKQATHLLLQYSINQQEEYYKEFQNKLSLQRGFEKARKTLLSENPNYDIARKGFQTANIHSKDINLLIWMTENFHTMPAMQKSINIWRQGDKYIAKLDSLGKQLHQDIQKNRLDREARNKYLLKITNLDQKLTELETSFSATMAKLARWIRDLIFWSIIGSGVIFLLVGYFITQRLFRDISDLNRQLAESESKFKKVLEYSRDVIYQLDFDSGDYQYMSPYVEKMLGYPPEMFLEGGRQFILDRIHPKDLERLEQELEEMSGKGVESHFASETEFRIKTKNGRYIWVNNQRSLVRDENGEAVAIVGSVRDISERKKHEVEIKKSLREKQTLLEEIHHRVKNNLAVISSLLELQKQDSNESTREALEDTQSRIQSIARIHEKLYQTDTFSDIDIQQYLEEFIEIVAQTFNSSQKNITIIKEIQSFNLDIIKALPLGLIMNELLNNAFKHGFSDRQKGKIKVTMKEEAGRCLFSVADTGTPLPGEFSLEDSRTLGMTLVRTLTNQLEGEINISQNRWKKFEITFPLSSKSGE